jgi:ribosomal protein S12 methylthiotransferase accessory factor YcaO
MKTIPIAGIVLGALAGVVVAGGVGWAVGSNAAQSASVQEMIQQRSTAIDAEGQRQGGERFGFPGLRERGHDENGPRALNGDDREFRGHMDEECDEYDENPADVGRGISEESTDEEMSPLQ